MFCVAAPEEEPETVVCYSIITFNSRDKLLSYLFTQIGVVNLKMSWSPGEGSSPQKNVSPKYARSKVYCL